MEKPRDIVESEATELTEEEIKNSLEEVVAEIKELIGADSEISFKQAEGKEKNEEEKLRDKRAEKARELFGKFHNLSRPILADHLNHYIKKKGSPRDLELVDEVIQKLFLKYSENFVKTINSLKQDHSVLSWLKKSAENQYIDLTRRRATKEKHIHTVDDTEIESKNNHITRDHAGELGPNVGDIAEFIENLEGNEKEVMERVMAGKKPKEIGEELKIDPLTVSRIKSRIIKEIRKTLGKK